MQELMGEPNGERSRVVVTRRLPEPVLAMLREGFEVVLHDSEDPMPHAAMVAAAQEADALVVLAMDRLDRDFLEALPERVRAVATYSVGHEHIDLAAARERGIAVLTTPDVLSDAVAEMGMLLMLGAARRAHEGDLLLRSGSWRGWTPTQLLGRDITGARLGIFGMGRIGQALARKARGFDMEIHYTNRSRLAPEIERDAHFHPTGAELCASSDILCLLAPVTPETRRFLDAAMIERLPRDAVVVNVGRGDLVDDDALIQALRSGRIVAAGLDVFAGEPRLDPRYLDLPNVFLQPHQGSSTLSTRIRMGRLLIDGITAVLAGARPSNQLP